MNPSVLTEGGPCRFCGHTCHRLAIVGGARLCAEPPAPGHTIPGFTRVRRVDGLEVLVRITLGVAAGGSGAPSTYRIQVGALPPRPLSTDTDGGAFPPGVLRPLLPLWFVSGGWRVLVARVAPWSASAGPSLAGGLGVEGVGSYGITVQMHPQGRAHETRDAVAAETRDRGAVFEARRRAVALWGE